MRRLSWISTLFLVCAPPLVAQVTFGPLTNYSAPSGSSQSKTISADLDHDGNPDLINARPGIESVAHSLWAWRRKVWPAATSPCGYLSARRASRRF